MRRFGHLCRSVFNLNQSDRLAVGFRLSRKESADVMECDIQHEREKQYHEAALDRGSKIGRYGFSGYLGDCGKRDVPTVENRDWE